MRTRLRLIVLGNVLMTFAYAFLTVPLKIINGGVTSFSLILSGVTGADTAVIANVITALFMILCYICLGKDYFMGSMLGGVCYMVSFSFFHSLDICLNRWNPRINIAIAMFVINLCVLTMGSLHYGLESVLFGIAFTGIQTLTLNIWMKVREKKH